MVREILVHMTTTHLVDPYDARPAPSAMPAAPLADPYEKPNPHGRPERPEDLLERHVNDGRPRVWLPDGSAQWYYSRPSSWGKKGEDTTNLSKWNTRTSVAGFLDYGTMSRTLRLEWAGTDPADKDRRNELCEQAKNLGDESARVGTALHAITERHDLGMSVPTSTDFADDLQAWVDATKHFEIVEMPSGRPGVEVFVALDYRIPDDEVPPGTREFKRWVRLAGTFDRLWRYKPCPVCGRRNYIGDLKSGKVEFGQQSIAVQEGVYANAKEYIPTADGAMRNDMPEVCPHRGVVVNLPAGSGRAQVIWFDIAKGYDWAVRLIPQIIRFRNTKNISVPFTPTPDLWALVERAETPEEVRALWMQYPGVPDWTERDSALTKFAGERIVALGGTPKTTT